MFGLRRLKAQPKPSLAEQVAILEDQIDALATRLGVYEEHIAHQKRRDVQTELKISEINRKIDRINRVHGA